MARRRRVWFSLLFAGFAPWAHADAPVASYIFPAGGQRGTTVAVRVGGLNLNSKAAFEMLGEGIEAPAEVFRAETLWIEGPLLPLPDSQQAEDYPKDYSGRITIATGAAPGPRAWRIWTAQGASGSLPFVVGTLPEIVEQESESSDSAAQPVTLPLTINGRVFPREDIDTWSFPLRAGEVLTARVDAQGLNSPLDPWVEARDDRGLRLAEGAPAPGCDSRLVFAAPRDGTYTIKIHDVNVKGGPGLHVPPHVDDRSEHHVGFSPWWPSWHECDVRLRRPGPDGAGPSHRPAPAGGGSRRWTADGQRPAGGRRVRRP
jgi:hypothetical protein